MIQQTRDTEKYVNYSAFALVMKGGKISNCYQYLLGNMSIEKLNFVVGQSENTPSIRDVQITGELRTNTTTYNGRFAPCDNCDADDSVRVIFPVYKQLGGI